jgi:hypothetical protein
MTAVPPVSPLAHVSPTRRILAVVDDEPYLADFEVIDRIDPDEVSRDLASIALDVLREVGVLANGGPVVRREPFNDVERSNADMLDRLDRLASIGAGARLA